MVIGTGSKETDQVIGGSVLFAKLFHLSLDFQL